MFEDTCIQIVSIPRAILFGANGACIDLGTTSLLGFVLLFVGAVVVLKIAGRFVLSRLFGKRGPRATARPAGSAPREDGPIRSIRD